MRLHLSKIDDFTRKIISRTFSTYKGKKVSISTDVPSNLDSYWDGGSKDSYVFYDVSQDKILPVHTNHPFFEKDRPRSLSKLPIGVLLVKHTIFCGKDLGITIYANECDLVPMIPYNNNVELSEEYKIVLGLTCGLKSFARLEYAERNGLSKEKYNEIKQELIKMGLLSKNGGISPEGRNVCQTFNYSRYL